MFSLEKIGMVWNCCITVGVFLVTICIWGENTSLQNLFFILGSIFSVKKFVPKLKTFFVSVINCSIMLHGLLLSVIIFLNQVVLRAAIKAFMLTIFKPPLQYSWHKTVFFILLVPVQIKLKNSSFRSLSSFSFGLGSEMNKWLRLERRRDFMKVILPMGVRLLRFQ